MWMTGDLMSNLTTFRNRRLATKRELLSLIGSLGFATKCIPAGRVFLRRFLDLAHSVVHLHHRVKLSVNFHDDVDWWLEYLPTWNGSCGFLELEWTPSSDLHLFTDAAGVVGCGAAYGHEWFHLRWPAWVMDAKPPISWLEMVPVYLACAVWGVNWHGKRLLFHSDNESVVGAWSKFSSPHKGLMDLIRRIYRHAATGNYALQITHISEVDNVVADALSRSVIAVNSVVYMLSSYPLF